MMAVTKQFGWLMILASCAAAQTVTTTLKGLKAVRSNGAVRVDIVLSSPIRPAILETSDPTRLVLDFPNVVAKSRQQRIEVNFNGIRTVRVGQYQADPPVTRVVVDMDTMYPYQVGENAAGIELMISPPVTARTIQRRPPPAAASRGILGVFRRESPSRHTTSTPGNDLKRPISSEASLPVPSAIPPEQKPRSQETEFPASATPPALPSPAATARVLTNPAFAAEPQAAPAAVATFEAGSAMATATAEATQAAGDQSTQPSILDPDLKTVFKVKYVVEGAAYLDGGRNSGLTEGMKLEVKDGDLPLQQGVTVDPGDPRVLAELVVVAVAETSAITDIHLPRRQLKPGDVAYLSLSDAQALVQQKTLSATRKYPMVVTFTEDDPQDEEIRATAPRPPQPSVNRARGWIGLDHMGTISHSDPQTTSSDLGLVVRMDITRINGSYWNLRGYWRGRLSSRSSATQPTLQDLINRTYHLGMTYENPNSRWVAGAGRLYLPWAPSLNTIDGGYFGARLNPVATLGVFGGSTPDPTSWNYNPDQRIGGTFVNFQGGSYDHLFYSSTSGVGISALNWRIDRPFVFFENSVSYKQFISIYDSLQADSPRGNAAVAPPGPGLSRNFLTLRLQVHPRLELDLNHNYFRDVPTFDPTLIGTGLLDKYLFQGFSVGARAEVMKQVFVYTDLGRSNRSGDAQNSWNEMVGVSFNRLPWFGLRADGHYSRFSSSFGDGSYKSVSLSRDFGEATRLSFLAGTQIYSSTLASNNRSHFVTGNVEWSFSAHYFMQGGFTVNRGGALSYDQWLFTVGYRFDSKARRER